jgi:hypothetical protein
VVLNALLSCPPDTLQSTSLTSKRLAELRKETKSAIRQIYKSIRSDPTSFANPINIDFHDLGRTRYYRLPTDIMLLESLTVMSGQKLLYLRAHAGRRLLQRMFANVSNGGEFRKDLTHHRASVGVYLHIQELLVRLAATKPTAIPDWLLTFAGATAVAVAFGINFAFNAVTVIATAAVGAVSLWQGHLAWATLFFGASLRTLIDALRSLSTTYWGRDSA